jgi:glycosyltransferase involved in cell wall biosynthesis
MAEISPLVSCIIPTRDRPQLVLRAIGSVFSQSHKKLQVIVVDDSQGSATETALKGCGYPIRYIRNNGSYGAPRARNLGLSEAQGDVVSFLDDDDQWCPDKLERQLGLLGKFPLVTCNYTVMRGGKRFFVERPPVIRYRSLLCENYVGSCSFVAASKDVMKGCAFDESLEVGQDWDLWLTIMEKHGIPEVGNAPQYLVDYNDAGHQRITNTSGKKPFSWLPICAKRRQNYDVETLRLFCMNDASLSGDSLVLRAARVLMKARFEGRGLRFMLQKILARFSRKLMQ